MRFNSSKLLIDPYAKAIAGQVNWADEMFGFFTYEFRLGHYMDLREELEDRRVGVAGLRGDIADCFEVTVLAVRHQLRDPAHIGRHRGDAASFARRRDRSV